jgi:hypothetical protein
MNYAKRAFKVDFIRLIKEELGSRRNPTTIERMTYKEKTDFIYSLLGKEYFYRFLKKFRPSRDFYVKWVDETFVN